MKKYLLYLLMQICIVCYFNAGAQVVFKETFGQTTVRQTSPYMPAASFGWGDPNGNSNEKMVENNYYTVIAPDYIRDGWPVPGWWFWTGAEPVGNTWGGAGNPATADHTGDLNGAVMVVNAGSTLSGFYSRTVNLVPGQCYRLSMWVYIVNASSMISMQLRDPLNNSTLGSYTSPFMSTEDTWQELTYDFTLPASCTNGGQVKVYLSNGYSSFGGNDYYVDDIQLATISCSSQPVIGCPSGATLALNRVLLTATANTKGIHLSWTADDESDAVTYKLQKSTNGVNFETIYTLNPTAGETKASHEYTDAVVAQSDKIYYRVSALKKSGGIVYSAVQAVSAAKALNSLLVYPQPATSAEQVNVKVNQLSVSAVTLYTITGVRLKTYTCYPGQMLTITGLKAGQYFLTTVTATGKIPDVTKLVVN